MRKKRFKFIVFCALMLVAVLASATLISPSKALADGAQRISGIGYWAEEGECNDPEGAGADFAVRLEGDLVGCKYNFVESTSCTGMTYRESGTEIFVSENGEGTFRLTYHFTGVYEDCSNLVGEVVGSCHHPIIEGSGTGIFTGSNGRLDFKDDIEAGNFPYRGHLK